ncbi:hypothetical protein BKA81DRAFT_87497 [Phyllosticta paracitricarpa]
MPSDQQPVWNAHSASIVAACCIIIMASLHTISRNKETSSLLLQSTLNRPDLRATSSHGLWTTLSRQDETGHVVELSAFLRVVTFGEEVTSNVAALLYGVCVGWKGVFYLTLLHCVELFDVPVGFRALYYFVVLCRPRTIVRWLWEMQRTTEGDGQGDQDQGPPAAVLRLVSFVVVVAMGLLSSPYDGFSTVSYRACRFSYSGLIGEDTWQEYCIADAQLFALVAVLGMVVVLGMVKLLEKLDRAREKDEEKEQEERGKGEDNAGGDNDNGAPPVLLERIDEAEEDTEKAADQRDPTPDELTTDSRLDPATIVAEARMRVEYLVHLAYEITTTYPPEDHRAAIHIAIQRDRATDLAYLYATPLDTAATPQESLNQRINAHFQFLDPRLSAVELDLVRRVLGNFQASAGGSLSSFDEEHSGASSWGLPALRLAHCQILLSRTDIAAFAEDDDMLEAAARVAVDAAAVAAAAAAPSSSTSSSAAAGTQDGDAAPTLDTAGLLPQLVRAFDVKNREGGYAKLWRFLEALKSEERVLRREKESLVSGEQRLAWKTVEREMFAGLIRKLNVGARKERRERMARNDRAQGIGSRSGRRGMEVRLV